MRDTLFLGRGPRRSLKGQRLRRPRRRLLLARLEGLPRVGHRLHEPGDLGILLLPPGRDIAAISRKESTPWVLTCALRGSSIGEGGTGRRGRSSQHPSRRRRRRKGGLDALPLKEELAL